MKPRIAPKTKTTLPDIKKKPSPKLSSSRLSRQSCSIETTVSIQSEPQRKQSQNKKSDQIVKNKSYYNHRALMNDYLKRTNMTIQTKVFTFNSQDDYIKRCLQSHGWVENHLSSALYDLKWVYTDNADDFVTQLDGQFYNHFKGTKELTTKQCLLVNFKNQSEYGFDTSDFFPRAFDLGNASDREDFLKEYERTCVEIILKRVVKYLKQRRKQYCKNIKQEIMINYEKKKQEKLIKKMELKKTIRRKFKTIYTAEQLQSENNDKDLRFDLQIISEVLSRLSDYKRQIEYGYYDDKNFELSTQYIIKTRQNYSQLQKFDQGHTPSQFMINKLFKYHFFFKKHDSGYKSDGVRNIWIVKPGGCARGQGIYLETDISEAINSGMQMQARLIQKYIERPLLYKKQKFDLRQWVLVRSFQPLKVYVFSHCYMRMCSQTYDLNDTKNLLRHLTNFSLNKQNFINQTQSIYSSDHLEEWLKSLNVDWQNTLRPQINEIIIKTLRIVQDQFEGESKYCFELFGFDIMLDEDYKPWLLEVNLSPACAERVDWLSTMLDQMAESMFNIIFGDEFKMPTQYKYELIFDEEVIGNQLYNQEFQWEVVGQKCNLRREKLIDKRYIEYMATLMIQKFYRMYLGKKQLKFLRNTKYAIVIQKYGRRYLATKQRYYLKRTYCAQRIQNTVRMFLAVKQKQHLKRQLNATKIQCLFRRKQAIKMKYYLKQEYCALLIQSLIYMKQAKQKSNQLKIHLLKYKLIQKNWRIIYKMKCNSSIRIQKIIRGKLQRKRFKILKQQNKSSIVIQKHYRGYKCRQLRQYLKREYSSLILQCLMRMKIGRRKLKLNKITDGLSKIDKVYETFNGRRSLVQIYNQGISRDRAIRRIQCYRMVIKCKRYLKRLKRLKKLINLQAYVKMHIQRKRYRRMIRRKRAIKKIILAMRLFQFRRIIMRRILLKKKKVQQQQQQQLPNRRLIKKK